MQTLVDVGLDYVRLGHPAPSLSRGEAPRIKLASELSTRSTGHTIYVLDEPATGLHFEGNRKLLAVLSRLVDQSNTVLLIEHNLERLPRANRGPVESSPKQLRVPRKWTGSTWQSLSG